ncbi:hypothetical protein BYT27DRAFT_7334269 [Phlegmacium glaucopus]|nr:hypothetical protein BYT27DRAFT_7334269 [Phlegmacium glaucopus]
MQFTREGEITAERDIAKYDKLKKNYEDPTYEVASSVFRALAGKRIIGSASFQRFQSQPQVDPFLLERYIFFVAKQPTLIEINYIHQVIFSRVGAAAGASTGRAFDPEILTKSEPECNSHLSVGMNMKLPRRI